MSPTPLHPQPIPLPTIVKTVVNRRPAEKIVDTNVRPWPVRAFRPEDAPLYRGFPLKSKIPITATTLVSSQGQYFSGDRPDPYSVDLGSTVRFIASDTDWDNIGLIWYPYVSGQIDWKWLGASGTQPILNDYTYQVGREVFNQVVLSFDDQQLDSQFNSDLDDALAFTLALALVPREDLTPVITAPSSGLNMNIFPGGMNCSWRGQTRQIQHPFRGVLNNFAFLIVSVSPPIADFYLAWNPAKVFTTQINSGSTATSDMIFTLGGVGSTFDLAEWNLWDSALDRSDVIAAIGDLTSIYGD